MKLPVFALILSALCAAAGEKVTISAESGTGEITSSEPLKLEKGDSAEFLTGLLQSAAFASVNVTVSGKTYTPWQAIGTAVPQLAQRIVIAGPAEIKLNCGAGGQPGSAIATFDVTRAGTASGPVPIPQEAGTVWQVILEASSDLTNWTAVQPGDYPSSTPQKYFRTRMVRKP